MDKKYNSKNHLVLIQCLIVFLFTLNISFAQDNSMFNKEPVLVLSGNAGDGHGEFGTIGQGDGMGPMDFIVDNNKDIWIMDVMNRRIQKFDKNGNFILEFPNEKNPLPFELAANYIECDQSGNIMVGPLPNGEIVVINNNGEYLHSIKLPDIQYEQIDFAVNNLGEVIYNHGKDTISMDINGNKLYQIKDGPLFQGRHSSPFSTSVVDTLGTDKIIDSDLKKSKENILIISKSKLIEEDTNSIDKDILFVDPFDNLFVKTFVSIKPPYKEYISYYSKNGKLIKKLKETMTQSNREKWGYTVYNIDKDGNFYAMEINKPEGTPTQQKDDEIALIHQSKPFLYIWKWER